MERTLFNRDGDAVAYIYEDSHVYGINGRHLGWIINDMIFNHDGERIGFTTNSCSVPAAKEPTKTEKYHRDEIMPRWAAPALPNLKFNSADQDFEEFLKDGQIVKFDKQNSLKSN